MHIEPRYDITFKLHENPNDMPESFHNLEACIEVDLAYFNAKIEFNKQLLTDDNLDNVLVHELLHIILEPLSHFATLAVNDKYKDMVRVLTESTIENLIPAIGDE